MVPVAKRTILKRLCCDHGWCYGVFWRFDHRNPMLLTVDDAYCEEQMETVVNGLLQQVHLLGEGIIGRAAFTGKHQWIYGNVWGEEYCSADNIGGLQQDNFEIDRQISSGIKTIAVIPVEQQGVVQVGATREISESLEFLDKVKDLYREIGSAGESLQMENVLPSSNNEICALNGLFASLLSSQSSYYGNLKPLNGDSLSDLRRDAFSATNPIQLPPCILDTYPGNLACMVEDVSNFSNHMQKPVFDADLPIAESDPLLYQSTSLTENATAGTPCISSWSGGGGSVLTSLEPSLPSDMVLDNFHNGYSMSTPESSRSKKSSIDSTSSSLCSKGLLEKNNQGNSVKSMSYQQSAPHAPESCLKRSSGQKRSSESLYSTEDCSNSCLVNDLSQWFADLTEHDIVGTASSLDKNLAHSTALSSFSSVRDRENYTCGAAAETKGYPIWSSVSDAMTMMEENSLKVPIAQRDVFNTFELDNVCKLDPDSLEDGGPWKGLLSKFGLEEILQGTGDLAINSSFQDPLPCSQMKVVEESCFGSKQFQPQNGPCSDGKNTSLNSTRFPCEEKDLVTKEAVFPKSQVGLWIGGSYSTSTRGASLMQPKKAEDPTKAARKRARPGESTRPRPKDRQQIQDRLKELRGMIPNGAKCSIDSLLDRTVKHMLFLQNMIKYADKLRKADEAKLIGQDEGTNIKSETRDSQDVGSSRGGTTWACEVGGPNMVCPIVVEDLGPPGQMLIEMLCDKQGLFLEIADVIRGFGLNILKGVIEVRENKIWSHFVVEANRHVTRMDVFWSLVQLVQETNCDDFDLSRQPSEAMDCKIHPYNDYKESFLPLPISLAETLL